MEQELNSIDPEILVGLDIGTTKIACFVGQRNEHGKIEILGYGKSESVGVSRGVVSNIDRTVQSIKAAVKAAEEDSGVEIKVVNVGIAKCSTAPKSARVSIATKATPAIIAGLINGIER